MCFKKGHFTVPLTRRCKSAGFGQEEMLRVVGHVVTESGMVRCRKNAKWFGSLELKF